MGKSYDQDFSILSEGVKFEGKLSSNGNVRIDGEFEGELIVNGNLTLGDKSKGKGSIKAANITCGGSINGSVEASEKLVLDTTAKIEGEISAKILVINEGANFKGTSNMNKETANSFEDNE
ncbi:MAG: polymer-forming cytoskeletal protein [Melioribacteraceae bacterium]|nr:polymer-forming cytoskeletal protein [Melioribacteraceae bacterium]